MKLDGDLNGKLNGLLLLVDAVFAHLCPDAQSYSRVVEVVALSLALSLALALGQLGAEEVNAVDLRARCRRAACMYRHQGWW